MDSDLLAAYQHTRYSLNIAEHSGNNTYLEKQLKIAIENLEKVIEKQIKQYNYESEIHKR